MNLDENSIEKHKKGETIDATNSRVIQFPGTRQKSRRESSRQIKNIDGIKYFAKSKSNSSGALFEITDRNAFLPVLLGPLPQV